MKTANPRPYYMHIVGEIADLSVGKLRFAAIDSTFKKILSDLNIKVIKSDSHEFPGGGLSIVYILSASHLAIHTWPEVSYLHFDLITCSPETSFEDLKREIEKAYRDAKVGISLIEY